MLSISCEDCQAKAGHITSMCVIVIGSVLLAITNALIIISKKKIYSFRILMQCINYSETHSEREGVYNWKTRTILHELIH